MAGNLTPEEAKELGRKGGLASGAARADRAKLRNDVLAKARFEQAADKMAAIIIDAAMGQGVFEAISPEKRAQFALKALEYGIGRARAEALDAPTAAAEQQSGLSFTVADELPTLVREQL